ncbi:hypothetical protein ACCO45_007320 [Purpureocillium lilacinum]|uniref:Uncharacterized protein n=1 Tax=Purpureocillium lilacinum TaxID=33203 RepID=A0ACC4DSS1_PURLI
MKFLTNILILGALAAPILASALPQPQDGDFDSLLSPNPEYDDGVEVFGKKVRKLPDGFCIPARYLFYISPSANEIASAEVQGECNVNGCHCTHPVRVCGCPKSEIGHECWCS